MRKIVLKRVDRKTTRTREEVRRVIDEVFTKANIKRRKKKTKKAPISQKKKGA